MGVKGLKQYILEPKLCNAGGSADLLEL